MKRIFDFFRRWSDKEDGNMAIEFVIMVPIFVAMISGVVDLSRVYVDQANYYSVARDTARIVARHGMTESAAEDYADAKANMIGNADVDVSVTTTNDAVTVTVSAPLQVLAKFGFLDFLEGKSVVASVTHTLEPV